MTGRCTRDGVAMRLARPRTLVEHNRYYRHDQSHHGRDRNPRRPEHSWILLYMGIRRAVRRLFRDSPVPKGRERSTSEGLFHDSGFWLVLQDHLECALLRRIPERVVRFHHVIEGKRCVTSLLARCHSG
jgi:hypothetical protein